jgi:hypothetical protein
MRSRSPHSHPLLLTALLVACPLAARADGVPVGPVTGEAQARPAVGSDGRGGAIVSYKTESLRVGAVHVSAAGTPDGGFGFAPSALPLSLEASEPLRASVVSASQLVLVSDRAAAASPALTRVNDGGLASIGFPVALSMPLHHAAIVPGRGGRTLLVAKDADATSFWTMRCAIVGVSGAIEFATQLSSPIMFFNGDAIDACSDGAGGLIAAMPYYDMNSTGSKDIAAWRMAADGSRPWGDVPFPLISASGDQIDVHVVPDGAGGALLAWTDPRQVSQSTDIYAMRIDADGARVFPWAFYGSPVCNALGAQSQSRITPDGSGGMWVIWLDQRAGVDGDLRYSHVLSDGSLAAGFTQDGTPLCGAAGAQGEAALAGDGAGGCFAVWRDDRSGTADLYVQHVLANGALAPGWAVNGRVLCNAVGVQDQPAIASVSGGQAVVAWRDARSGTARVYAAGVSDPATTAVAPGVPSGLKLAASGSARHLAEVRVTLPAGAPAVLELLDVSGRVCGRSELAGPMNGDIVALAPAGALARRLYFARLRQGEHTVSARITVLR